MNQTAIQENARRACETPGNLTEPLKTPAEDIMEYAKAYARERPEVVALWALGIGFVLGWKLKPW